MVKSKAAESGFLHINIEEKRREFNCHKLLLLSHLISQLQNNQNMLRRKDLVSTDAVCNDFVRQSYY